MEYRAFDLADAGTYANGRKFHGEALVYGQPSPLPAGDGRQVYERIERGAFPETTAALLREHQPHLLLARRSVSLTHGERLVVDAELLDTEAAREAAALVEAGELRGMSVGFRQTAPWSWERRGGQIHRALPPGGGSLKEISLVAFPAHENTSASVRSITIPDAIPGGMDIERWGRYLDRVTA